MVNQGAAGTASRLTKANYLYRSPYQAHKFSEAVNLEEIWHIID